MEVWKTNQPFSFESGALLPSLKIGYTTYGTLNAERNNVVWVCHALTANSAVDEWWPGMVGPGLSFDTEEKFIICANVIGGCYGSSGPLTFNEETGEEFYYDFPHLTIRDIVHAHRLLAAHLEINQIEVLVGASLGGQQALEWAIEESERIERLILIATNATHSPWGIAFNESQRMAIRADSSWGEKQVKAGLKGMRAARAMALLSYRNYEAYALRQTDSNEKTNDFMASSYQRYQGEKLADRFNALTYYRLSEAMDSHNVGRGRGGITKALSQISAETMVIGISSDVLFPSSEQSRLANEIPNAQLLIVDSDYGHDGFLVETKVISAQIHPFINPLKKEAVRLDTQ